MKCPFCGSSDNGVVDSRETDDGRAIRRRRNCAGCARRFTTYERLEEMEIKVVKKNNVREPFDREKIRSGLAKACWKRPVSDEQIEQIVSLVESDVYATGDGEIDSHLLGEMVMQRLAAVDQVAFVRFASVYRRFKDVRDFVDELQPILKKNAKGREEGTKG